MAWRYIFKCDGCDAERTEKENFVPDGWAKICIRIHGFRNMGILQDRIEKDCTLCGSCQQKLYDVADPGNWRVA